MIELLFALGIILLAMAGVGLGLLLGGRPAATSCGAAACLPTGVCATCPNRRDKQEDRV